MLTSPLFAYRVSGSMASVCHPPGLLAPGLRIGESRADARSLHAEVDATYRVVGAKFGARAFAPNPALLQHVDAIGDMQRGLRVLLGHQNRGAALLNVLDGVEDL